MSRNSLSGAIMISCFLDLGESMVVVVVAVVVVVVVVVTLLLVVLEVLEGMVVVVLMVVVAVLAAVVAVVVVVVQMLVMVLVVGSQGQGAVLPTISEMAGCEAVWAAPNAQEGELVRLIQISNHVVRCRAVSIAE